MVKHIPRARFYSAVLHYARDYARHYARDDARHYARYYVRHCAKHYARPFGLHIYYARAHCILYYSPSHHAVEMNAVEMSSAQMPEACGVCLLWAWTSSPCLVQGRAYEHRFPAREADEGLTAQFLLAESVCSLLCTGVLLFGIDIRFLFTQSSFPRCCVSLCAGLCAALCAGLCAVLCAAVWPAYLLCAGHCILYYAPAHHAVEMNAIEMSSV